MMTDCRESPSVKGCTLTIAGEEDEVLRAAVMHAVDAHGHRDTPELREQVRGSLKPEAPGR
jgi:predicted small metal-binding protein